MDLFAGAGGLSLGFEMIRDNLGRPVYELYRAVEINKFACQTLKFRYGSEKIIEGDLTKRETHERVIEECKGKISIVVAGIPCQSFSQIGPRSGYGKKNEKYKKDHRDHLYKDVCNIIKEIKPKIIILENVRGILSKKDQNGKKIIDKIIFDLEIKLGYNLKNTKTGSKFMLLNAENYGVPQRRQRVIIIGFLKEWTKTDVPFVEPTHFNPKLEKKKKNGLRPYVTLFEAIGDLPEVQPKITNCGLSEKERKKTFKINEKINNGSDKIPFDRKRFKSHQKFCSDSAKEFFDFIKTKECKYIYHHIARSQQRSDLQLFKQMKAGETSKSFMERKPTLSKKLIKYDMNSFDDKYRRQKIDEPCTTIFAHLTKDGNRFIHPIQVRTLTPREAARIQSFPDDFIFQGPLLKKFTQIGNAVPPLLARAVANSIKEALDKT